MSMQEVILKTISVTKQSDEVLRNDFVVYIMNHCTTQVSKTLNKLRKMK